MTAKVFPVDYPELTSLADTDAVAISAGGAFSWASWQTVLAEAAAARGPRFNVLSMNGVVGDGANDDTAGIIAAYGAAVALGVYTLHFPAGAYIFDNQVLSVLDDNFTFDLAAGAKITFKNAGQWKFGSDAHATAFPAIRGGTLEVDASSSVSYPIWLYNCGRVTLSCWITNIRTSGVGLRQGTVWARHCDTTFYTGVGTAVFDVAPAASLRCALFIQGGRYSAPEGGSRAVIKHTGAGIFDGCGFLGCNTTQIAKPLDSAPASGGQLSNCVAFGCLFDQVEQQALHLHPAAGATLSDVSMVGCKVNGWGSSTASSGALVTIDLISGATHTADCAIRLCDNTFTGARVRGVECLGGTLASLIVSRNTFSDYGRQAAAGSRAIYIAGTIDYLEVVDNNGQTSRTHDYDIEFGTVALTRRRVQDNVFGGASPANLATYNQAAYDQRTQREQLTAARTYYVGPAGSDANAGLVSMSPFATIQKALNVACSLDLNGQIVTIQLADGTYAAGFASSWGVTPAPAGGGLIVIQGNSANRSAVFINTSGDCFQFNQSTVTRFRIKDLKVQSGAYGINVAAVVNVQYQGIVFGACTQSHLNPAATGAVLALNDNNCQIIGGGNAHGTPQLGGFLNLGTNRTLTVSGTPTFTDFFQITAGACQATNTTYSGGGITGRQFTVQQNGTLATGGHLAAIPGSGTNVVSGGQAV